MMFDEEKRQRLTAIEMGRLKQGTIIAIGSATGGNEALNQILSVMPTNAPPTIIAQHIPATFVYRWHGALTMGRP